MENAKKPKLKIMEDRVKRYQKEIDGWKMKHQEVVRTLSRVLVNIQRYGHKLDVSIDELMTKEVEPLAYRRVSSYTRRFKKNY